MIAFTAEQARAIAARGNTLVLAGAGSGKTRTLVERCARLLLDEAEPVSVRNVLIVTFNEGAAAEVRERLRRRLEEEGSARALAQIAGLDAAQISTLHSFCYKLLREHFYALELDPSVAVLDGPAAQVLFQTTIEELLAEHYAGVHSFSGELKEVIRTHFNAWEKPLIELVRKVHEFTQTRPDPEGWFQRQLAALEREDSSAWEAWHRRGFAEWCAWWLPKLGGLNSIPNAQTCAALLREGADSGDLAVLPRIVAREDCWSPQRKKYESPAFGNFFEEAKFLESLRHDGQEVAPLLQDWQWSREVLRVLVRFSGQFARRFSEAKQDRCALDFHDLEQGALKLLWRNGEPSEIALQWRQRFNAVFVDEYQDINAAQDLIIRAVSDGNRFLVGDNKQSIYRFRQADPAIFQRYLGEPEGWERAFLSENFRSHEGILNFINPLFTWLMRREIGGVSYDEKAALRFGDVPERSLLKAHSGEKQVELHVIFSGAGAGEDEEDDASTAELEARLVARRLKELRGSGFEIAARGAKRPVEWSDMVVLLRSAAGKLEIYAKEFEAAGVPLHTKQNAFYTTQEVLDLSNLLTILDNPWQDIPLVAVLRSPLCGMSASELVSIRIASKARPFWRVLDEYHSKNSGTSAWAKADLFLTRYEEWRSAQASASLGRRLEKILADTGYDEWLLTQTRGTQRYANVQQFVRVAREFDQARGESLYQFILHIRELQDAVGDIEPVVASQRNSVRLMTVHHSKGLEFPVVAAPDLGKKFNWFDQSEKFLIDEEFGLCGTVKPPETGAQYPSLPLWLARRKQKLEVLGEEIRLAYVTMTRAQNHLLLFGTATQKQLNEKWPENAVPDPLPHHLAGAGSWLDWIGAWAGGILPGWTTQRSGECEIFRYTIHANVPPSEPDTTGLDIGLPQAGAEGLERRIETVYAHVPATRETAKTSVSRLRKRSDHDGEARTISFQARGRPGGKARGVACHTFLEHLDLNGPLDAAGLGSQAALMVRDGILEGSERGLLDLESLADFWRSEPGRELLERRAYLRRELPFTCRLTRDSLAAHGLEHLLTLPEDEFVVLQGIADLAILAPGEIWLLDFKTDEVKTEELSELAERYATQVALYALALESVYARQVTRKGLYSVAAREFAWL